MYYIRQEKHWVYEYGLGDKTFPVDYYIKHLSDCP